MCRSLQMLNTVSISLSVFEKNIFEEVFFFFFFFFWGGGILIMWPGAFLYKISFNLPKWIST